MRPLTHCTCPSVRPSSVPRLCHLLNVPTHQFADVPFNWQQPAAATADTLYYYYYYYYYYYNFFFIIIIRLIHIMRGALCNRPCHDVVGWSRILIVAKRCIVGL